MGLVSVAQSLRQYLQSAGALSVVVFLGVACSSSNLTPNGVCAIDAAVSCTVSRIRGLPVAPADVLDGYSCSGAARPDENAKYVEGIPQGVVCASVGDNGSGKPAYCCSRDVTPCAYNPIAACDPGSDGYQCRGSSRPEALNPAIKCGNGVTQGDLINYCCSGQPSPPVCDQVNTVGCSERLTGFSCPGLAMPKSEQFGASESRADYYRPLCPVPIVAKDITRNNYCCYMPALPPEGASCVQDTQVPSCKGGRFGFACYGPDTPPQDYPPMNCPEPGFAGTSAEGYPATLYCCDFT